MIFADSAFERPECIRSKFWYIMWLRIFYVLILHDFCKECTCQHCWTLNCCFGSILAFYATSEWFEVLSIVQRVPWHTIDTSKAYFDIAFVTLHTYTNLHTHLVAHISSYIYFYQYYIFPSTHVHTHLPLYRYVHTNICLPTHTYTCIYYTHALFYVYTLIYIQRYYSE